MSTEQERLLHWQQESPDTLWPQFLKIQAELFLEKECAPFFSTPEWQDARNVLEIGCGSADVLARLHALFPEKSYVGMDKNALFLQQAQREYPSLTLLQGDAEMAEPSLLGRFDLVLFRLTLQHLKDPRAVLQHAHTYLRPGGFVLIIDAYDEARFCSLPMPELDQAIAALNARNQERSAGNRQITLQLQHELHNPNAPLSKLFELRFSNLDDTGQPHSNAHQVIVYSHDNTSLQQDYHLLFLLLVHKGWDVAIDFDAARKELAQFKDDPDAWIRPGKHLLLLQARPLFYEP